MISIISTGYIVIFLSFMVFGVLNFSNSLLVSHTSKSREFRQLSKLQLERDKKVMLLSIIWPVILFSIIKHAYEKRHIVFPKRFSKPRNPFPTEKN
tara:strand:- start:42 stop:329 length:288 start_codon:yes stop_codon:yes gene_type:complete